MSDDENPAQGEGDNQTTGRQEAVRPVTFDSVEKIEERSDEQLQHGYQQRVEYFRGISHYVRRRREEGRAIDPGERDRIDQAADRLRWAPTTAEGLAETVRSQQEVHQAWNELREDLHGKG
jgi:hypothetical protein